VQAGFTPDVVQWVVELPAVLSLVAAGIGVALIPRSLQNLYPQSVRITELGRQAPHADVYAVQRTVAGTPAMQEFVRLAAGATTA
jgi:LysR family transcriptional regulator, benzoate and cis,cis-muconate-responsive activator of ben and cat genes